MARYDTRLLMTIKTFFEEYERLTNEGDAETVSRLFAPVFVSVDPSGHWLLR